MLKPIHKNEFNAPAKFSFNRWGHLIPLVTSFCNIAIVCRRQVDKSNTPYPAATVPRAKGAPGKVLICVKFEIFVGCTSKAYCPRRKDKQK